VNSSPITPNPKTYILKKAKLTTETVTVSPETAEEWYLLSGGNRPIRPSHVEFLIEQMKHHWELNGEAIIFDWNGKLIEGHHRLHLHHRDQLRTYDMSFEQIVAMARANFEYERDYSDE